MALVEVGRRGRRGALLAATTIILAASVLAPLARVEATAANPDCDTQDRTLLGAGWTRVPAAAFTYLAGDNPLYTQDAEIEAAIRLAGETWTRQLNDCGRPDRSAVAYSFRASSSASGTTANHGNGVSEVLWECVNGCAGYVAYATTRAPAECDIVLNPTFADHGLPFGETLMYSLPQVLPTILAHEMGHCIGLGHPPDFESDTSRLHTMSRGYCFNHPLVTGPLKTPVLVPPNGWYPIQVVGMCGITLSMGDMLGLEQLWPV